MSESTFETPTVEPEADLETSATPNIDRAKTVLKVIASYGASVIVMKAVSAVAPMGDLKFRQQVGVAAATAVLGCIVAKAVEDKTDEIVDSMVDAYYKIKDDINRAKVA